MTLGECPTTISASKRKGGRNKDDNINVTPFASVKDNMKGLNTLIKGVKSNLSKGFEQEGILKNHNEDDAHVTKLKKLKVKKEAYNFAK